MRRLGRRSLAGPPAAHAVVLKTISRPPPPQPSSLLIGTRATLEPHGGVAEWFKAAVLKTAVPETVPGVRIPPPPPLVAFAALWICAFSAPALGSTRGAR